MNTASSASASVLELRGIGKTFGTVVALDAVDFSARAGSVHALLGENGAGKSTLMRIAYGMLRPDAGSIRALGVERRHQSVRDAIREGIGMVHQHHTLVPSLTAEENLVLGRTGRLDLGAAAALLGRLSEESGLRVTAGVAAGTLSIVEQQRLEILKALARDARLLILDEPTAVLAPQEVDELLRWIRAFADGGGSVILVTHKLREALGVADDVTVLRRGAVVSTTPARDVDEATLARSLFADALPAEVEPSAPKVNTDVLVEAAHVDVADARGARRIRNATFLVRRHEIVGVAAVDGSGHRELLSALANRRTPAAGSLRLPSRIAYVPADRLRDALIPEFTLVENVALRDAGARRGLMSWDEIELRTNALTQEYGVVAASSRTAARTLSGGNQQRLVLARELQGDVDLVVADNPTRGLDLRATSFVHDRLRACAARGAAVVVHSSDLDEVLSLATRVLVVFGGEIHPLDTLDRAQIGNAMVGAFEPRT